MMAKKKQLWEIQVTLQDEHIETMDTSNESLTKKALKVYVKELDNTNNAMEKVASGHHDM